MTSPVIHPNSSSLASSSLFFISQYSCAFFQLGCTGFLFLAFSHCCTFPSVECATPSHLLFSFSTAMFEYSHLRCPVLLHLKHCISSTTSCFLTFTSPLRPHLITLLVSTLNLFWRVDLPFFSCSLFLQLWAKCPNFLYPQHTFPSLPSISALSLARACH